MHALLVIAMLLAPPVTAAEQRTVCTITVNSPDEKDSFRRWLPAPKHRFVELVERGRPDWLAAACRSGVSCDVLVVSGHFDGDNQFFSDQLDRRESLAVSELERASCSESCPGVFARLKEVYLFGCNTLNPVPQSSASAEVVRSLVREGLSREQARHLLRGLNPAGGQSSRDRMRQVFKGVPVIYGFSSAAPLGPIAASALDRYFAAAGPGELGQGRASARLLAQFAPQGLSVARGIDERDLLAAARRDVCVFADDRLPPSSKLHHVQQLLQRDPAQAALQLDRIQRQLDALDDGTRRLPDVAAELESISGNILARGRFLAFARATDSTDFRVRLLKLAQSLGWLSADENRDERVRMLGDLQARSDVGLSEVDLACTLNQDHELDGTFNRRVQPGGPGDTPAHRAIRACLGSSEAHALTVQGLLGSDEAAQQVAQAYLRVRPIEDPAELHRLAQGITAMAPSEQQVRALETLGRHDLSTRELLDLLIGLYAQTPSAPVQGAVAGILLRADLRVLGPAALLRMLRERRLPSSEGAGLVDALIGRLQAR